MTPKISVIIPTHNRRLLVKRAVDSVLKQTYPNFEILLVDDGSTDKTRGLLDQIDARLRYFFQENSGVACARNLGIRHARGEWLAFLDSDDYWLPNKLETQIGFHEKMTDFKISQTNEIWIRRSIRVNATKKHEKLHGWIFEPSLSLCLISPSTVLISREVFDKIGLFDESLPVCEDYELWLRATLFFPVGLVETPLVVKHGGHPDQLSRRYWGMDRFRIRAIEKTLSSFQLSPEKRSACLKELDRKCRIYAKGCLKRGRTDEANFFLELSRKYSPDNHALLQA